jgi:hypothetical protein
MLNVKLNSPIDGIDIHPGRLPGEWVPAAVDEYEIIGFIFDEIYPDCRYIRGSSLREKSHGNDPDDEGDERGKDEGADYL